MHKLIIVGVEKYCEAHGIAAPRRGCIEEAIEFFLSNRKCGCIPSTKEFHVCALQIEATHLQEVARVAA